MKKTLALGLLMTFLTISSFAASCPKLTGQYLCEDLKDSTRKDVLTIHEKVNSDGIVIYHMNQITLQTDNETYRYTDHETEEIQNAFKIASCHDDKLHFEQWGDFVSKKGKKFGDFKVLSKFSLSPQGDFLILDQVGDYFFTEFGHYPIDVGQECPRL